jgi:hypothetical protein
MAIGPTLAGYWRLFRGTKFSDDSTAPSKVPAG